MAAVLHTSPLVLFPFFFPGVREERPLRGRPPPTDRKMSLVLVRFQYTCSRASDARRVWMCCPTRGLLPEIPNRAGRFLHDLRIFGSHCLETLARYLLHPLSIRLNS